MASQPRSRPISCVGQDFAGPQVALAAQVEADRLELEALEPGDGREHLEALGRHFRADAVARDDTELDQNTLRDNSLRTEIRPRDSPIVTTRDRSS